MVTRLRAPPGHGWAGRFLILLKSRIHNGDAPTGVAVLIDPAQMSHVRRGRSSHIG